MTRTQDREAWGSFWQTPQGGSGCLPEGLRRIDDAQRRCWEEFAIGLPRGARVLDLATGNGAVLRRFAGVRPDLKLTGVDSAPTLPAAPHGIALKPNVAIEDLPFADGAFAAVTSQFGIEYGEIGPVAAEIGRVLRPGGRFRAIVHHAESPVLVHNRSRREGLHWALESGWLAKARAFAQARQMGPLPTPPAFREAPGEARRRFPGQPVAEEFVTAILQTLELGRRAPPRETIEVLGTLEARARNEMARIASLERSVCDEARIGAIGAALEASGVGTRAPGLLHEAGSARPFAWLVDGERR